MNYAFLLVVSGLIGGGSCVNCVHYTIEGLGLVVRIIILLCGGDVTFVIVNA